jgi:hypothetical protein
LVGIFSISWTTVALPPKAAVAMYGKERLAPRYDCNSVRREVAQKAPLVVL